MTRLFTLWSLAWLLLGGSAHAQRLQCMSDSPERRGEPGCSIIDDKRLPAPPQQPVMWHIDEFETLRDLAASVAGPDPSRRRASGHDGH